MMDKDRKMKLKTFLKEIKFKIKVNYSVAAYFPKTRLLGGSTKFEML